MSRQDDNITSFYGSSCANSGKLIRGPRRAPGLPPSPRVEGPIREPLGWRCPRRGWAKCLRRRPRAAGRSVFRGTRIPAARHCGLNRKEKDAGFFRGNVNDQRALHWAQCQQAPESTVGQPMTVCRQGIFAIPCAEWYTSVDSRRLST
eukprot:8715334-Pyramimonas_sp.AAC.2